MVIGYIIVLMLIPAAFLSAYISAVINRRNKERIRKRNLKLMHKFYNHG